jgi:riboflavin kinase/FMN adenylyltransferase
MLIYNNINELPQFDEPIITIGSFDGVHIGHQTILNQIVVKAHEQHKKSVLITFHPHPRKLVNPNEPIKLLNSLDEKLERIEQLGIDICIIVPFTKDFAGLSAQHYVEDFLIKKLNPSLIIIGYDHHFGNDRSGNIELLKQYATKGHFDLIEISAQLIHAAAISSTQIRKALLNGDIDNSAQMLGYNYSISGKVVYGKQLGRTIGYPTANIDINDNDKLIPLNGVYFVHVLIDTLQYPAMLNIGTNPTVSTTSNTKIEVHIFNFDLNIYDKEIGIVFLKRIRDEQKFESIEALKKQLSLDEAACKNLIA